MVTNIQQAQRWNCKEEIDIILEKMKGQNLP